MTLRIGLTGALGSGKSAVARILASVGAQVIDADRLAREVTAPGSDGLARIGVVFGPEMLDAQGALDRRRMGDLVFSDAEALARLNAIVHPLVHQRMLELLADYEGQGVAVVALDIPLLFEAGMEGLVDCVVTVTTPLEQLYERLSRNRGLTRREVDQRLAAQWPQEEKARRADHVIPNTGDLKQLRRVTLDLLRRIESDPSAARRLPHA